MKEDKKKIYDSERYSLTNRYKVSKTLHIKVQYKIDKKVKPNLKDNSKFLSKMKK